jgi:hypothetical protein
VSTILVTVLLGLVLEAAAAPPSDVPAGLGAERAVGYVPLRRVPDVTPDAASLRADAASLVPAFRVVVLDDAPPSACRVFRRRGFTTVLIGVRDPADPAELRAARRLRRCADGYVVGSGGLLRGRYGRADVERAIATLGATGRPVGVREPLRAFRRDPSLYALGAWAMPIVHPVFGEHAHPQATCGWMLHRTREVTARAPGRAVIFAEVGFPTAGAPALSENYQRAFFACIESRGVHFTYWAAFDEPWRAPPAMAAHLGLFRADGTPKQWAALQAPPGITLAVVGGVASGRATNVAAERAAVVVWTLTGGWRLAGRAAVDRHGRWQLQVPTADGYAAALVAPGWTAPASLERLPAVDGAGVLARSDLGPLGTTGPP